MIKFIKDHKDIGKVEPNSLVLGDCLDVMSLIPDHSVHCVLTDLPYG